MGNIKTIEELKEIDIFKNDKHDNLLRESVSILQKDEFKNSNFDLGDVPISPISLKDNPQSVFFSKEVVDEYNSIISKLNNPSTAFEYAYLLVGSTDENNNVIVEYIFDVGVKDSINNRQVVYDNQRLNNIVKLMSDNGANFISICHTHPLIPQEELRTTIATYLSDKIMSNEHIRTPGLNLSLQDIISYNSLYNQAKKYFPNVTFSSTVLMYSGEIVMLGIENGQVVRYTNIYSIETKEKLPVSLKEDFENKKYR